MEKADFIKRLVALRVSKGASARVMRQSQAQIGAISAPICAFYHHSFGGFSIVSVQSCPLFSDSGSKVGQDSFRECVMYFSFYSLCADMILL